MISARPVLLAATLLILDGAPIRIEQIVIHGQVHPVTREVRGTITTDVRIPFGKVPVTGQARVRYGCNAHFSGTLDYGSVVRVLARMKGVALVSVMEGRLDSRESWDCRSAPGDFTARFSLRETAIAGHVVSNGSSVTVSGRAWDAGGGVFHTRMSTTHGGGGYTLHVSFYERGH